MTLDLTIFSEIKKFLKQLSLSLFSSETVSIAKMEKEMKVMATTYPVKEGKYRSRIWVKEGKGNKGTPSTSHFEDKISII